MIPVFDGHNDFLLRLHRQPDRARLWQRGDGGQIDLPRARAGGFAGGLFAIFVPSEEAMDVSAFEAAMDAPPYDLPLPPPVALGPAQSAALGMAGHLLALARETPEDLRLCTTAAGIEAAMADGAIAAVMHMEGAEAIGPDLDALHVFHAMGLRSLGPVWSRPTAFGHGVPFRCPGDPDIGPGLTEAGRRLVAECHALRLVVDLSHLNAAGVDEVAAMEGGPLVATHSNAHAVTPSSRNLTDRQLDRIRESDGIVGLNFATVFLNEDGRRDPSTGWEPMLRHLDHLIGRLGEDRVGFGSDFDGAQVPGVLGDVAGLPFLLEALERHGFDRPLIEKLAHRNWIAALRRVWGA